MQPDDDKQPLTLREMLGSILAAIIGVQSSRNQQRDFTRGSARNYIVAGIVATALFVLAVYFAVKLILALATG